MPILTAFGVSAVLAVLGLYTQISTFRRLQKDRANLRDDEYIDRLI